VGEEIADADELAVGALEFGEIAGGGIVKGDEAAFDEEHEGDGVDGFGDGGEEVDGVGFGAEAFVEDDGAVADNDDGRGVDAAGLDLFGEELGGAGEAGFGHAGSLWLDAAELSREGHGGKKS
jgi:hypothetical protein